MALRRRGKGYLGYLKNGSAGEGVIPYNTWRRWLDQGKITKERLMELGINPGVQRQRRQAKIHQHERLLGITTEGSVTSGSSVQDISTSQDNNLTCSEILQSRSQINDSLEVLGSASRPSQLMSGMGSVTDTCNLSATLSDCDIVSDSSSVFGLTSSSECSSDNELDYGVYDNDEFNRKQGRISSVLQSKKIGVEALNQPLAPNLKVTKFETLLMIFHLAMRHSLTDVFLEDMTDFVNELVGEPDAVPGSKWLFQKLFMFGSQPTVHFFCPQCNIYLGPKSSFDSNQVTCDKCEWMQSVSNFNDGHYFVTLNLKDQLKTLLERPNTELISRGERTPRVLSDVMDGEIYQKLMKNHKPHPNSDFFTISVSTDGSPVYKNGQNTLYPIHFHVNEIPADQRFNVENMLLGGLWFSKIGEPNLQIFLHPLVDELRALSKSGVVWKKGNGSVIESLVYLLCCCTDSVARPKVLNMMQFNGSYGCSYCLHPNTAFVINEPLKPGKGIQTTQAENQRNNDSSDSDNTEPQQFFRRRKLHRYLAEMHPLRTNKRLRKHMKLASRSHLDHIYGAKGECVLGSLPYMDVVFGIPLDYMHLVLIGVVKKLASLWFDRTSNGQPYYIGLLVDTVNLRLEKISPSSNMTKPRSMSDRAHWKAKEWRGFLLYYGLPCLLQVLPDEYFYHFKKLVTAIYILTKQSIGYDEAEESDVLLHHFVAEYQTLYGESNMVFNVHGLLHLATQVAKLGPLWAYSMFPFESANGRLVKIVKGTKGVAFQIARKYLMTQQVCKLLQGNYTVKDNIIDFCSKVVEYKYAKNSNKYGCVTVLGIPTFIELSEEQKSVLRNHDLHAGSIVKVYNRAIMNRTIFASKQLGRQKAYNDSCVRLANGSFAMINLIIAFNESTSESDVWCIATELNIALNPSVMPAHIKQCSLDPYGVLTAFSFMDIREKCIFLPLEDKYFVAEFSNTVEKS